MAKPPTKPVNPALSGLRKSVAMNPARKSPHDTMALGPPCEKAPSFTPTKSYVANSAQKRLSYDPAPKGGLGGLTPAKPRKSLNETTKSTSNRSAMKTPNKSRASPGAALVAGHRPANSMSMPVSYKTSPTDRNKPQPS